MTILLLSLLISPKGMILFIESKVPTATNQPMPLVDMVLMFVVYVDFDDNFVIMDKTQDSKHHLTSDQDHLDHTHLNSSCHPVGELLLGCSGVARCSDNTKSTFRL